MIASRHRITATRVVIARAQHRHLKGGTYCVRIHISLPAGRHIDVDRDRAGADGMRTCMWP
jgi:hypothetical protein